MTDQLPPLARLRWVPRDRLTANSWNPNHVAPTEMELLETSLIENSWTQPIVSRPVGDGDAEEIVDGFHRWSLSERDSVAALTAHVRPGENRSTREAELESTLLKLLDALDELADTDPIDCVSEERRAAREQLARYDDEDRVDHGKILVPVVTLAGADLPTLMMATVRHNRARGAHHVLRMADIVAELHGAGLPDDEIARRMGMEPVEVERLLQRGKMSERGAADTMGKAWHPELKEGA